MTGRKPRALGKASTARHHRFMLEPAGSDWTTTKIDLIVVEYFAMLGDEVGGWAYVKA